MALDIRDAVYSGISNQFPSIYQEDGDFLVSFVEAYYKHLDEKMDRNIPKLRDIDTTLSTFLIYYKKKYLADLPIDTALDTRYIIKHIQDMYRRKGTQESLELMFRMFFDEDIEVFYPSTAVLRPSDSIWGGDAYLEMVPVFTVDNYPVQKGQRLRGDVSLATAFVDEVIFVNFGGALVPVVYLSNIAGQFVNSDGIQIVTTADDGSETVNNVGRLISGSISSVSIDTQTSIRLPDQVVGDKVKIVSSGAGVEAEGRVTKISDTPTGVIDFTIVDGGFGYVDPSSATLTAKNEIGISNQVMVLSSTTPVDIERGDLIIADGTRLSYTGSSTGTKYSITGSAKVIQYEHPLLFLYSDDYATVKTYLNKTAVPVAGTITGTATNAYLETMRNVAHKALFNAQSVLAPQYLGSEYTALYKALQLPNQAFPTDSGAGAVSSRSLGFFVSDDMNNTNPSITSIATVGVQSRQIMQEYINVLNLSNNLPVFNPDIYDQSSSVLIGQWKFYLESLFLGLSKADIFPQMLIGGTKVGGPTTQQNIVNNQYYMIWDNGHGTGDWSTYGASTAAGVEGEIFQANQDFDFSTLSNTTHFHVVAQGNLSNAVMQNYHLNRLRFDANTIDSASSTPRVSDKSGSVVSTPSVLAPSFSFKRYRGDLARYDSSVTDISKQVFLDNIGLQSFGISNRTGDFEIGSISNVETVTLIPDLIGDFALTPLDVPSGQPGGAVGTANDDYGMSGPGNENLGTTLGNAFNPITLKIGSISELNILNSGVDYQNDVGISIENTNISKFNKKDVVLNFDTVDFDISAGDTITQNIKVADLQINQTGNRLHDDPETDGSILLESLGTTSTGSNYENSDCTFEFTTGDTKEYQVKAKFLKRDGNDFYFRPISFYGFEGNRSLATMQPNQEYQIVSLGNTNNSDWVAVGASSAPKVGEIFTSTTTSAISAAIGSGDKGTVIVPVKVGGFKKRITNISEDPNSLPMGANADIKGKAMFQSGQIEEVAVTKTGYRYSDRETVSLVNNEPTSTNYNKNVATATLRSLGQGKTGGKWSSKTSFLSESSKNLHDNDYYQEYSYEISSIINPSRYESLISETVGVAGTKLFSKPLVNTINTLDNDLNLEISTFNIQGKQLATVKQIGIADIVAGTEYTVTLLGDTTSAQWSTVGVPTNSEVIQGRFNLELGVSYVISDIGSASWSDVQFLDSDSRLEWYNFWNSVLGSYSSLVPDFNNSGTVTSLDALQALRQVTGLDPISPELLANLNTITDGLVISSAFTGSFNHEALLVDAPAVIDLVKFTKTSVPVGTVFTASVNGSSLGTGKVSYKDSIFVSPHYTGDTYSPQAIRPSGNTYTLTAGGSATDSIISNYPVVDKFYVVHSMENLEDMDNTATANISMNIGTNPAGSNRVTASAIWSNIIDGSETQASSGLPATWPRLGTIFKADAPTNITTSGARVGNCQIAEITDSLVQFSASDISSLNVTKSGHGLIDDTIVQYYQYRGTSSGNLIGNTSANRAAEYEYYYVVNVTNDTFQLSKTPAGDGTGDTPIDLSGLTGGPHLLIRQTGIYTDDAELIGIQEQ